MSSSTPSGSNIGSNTVQNTPPAQDPVRWGPSGVPQTWTIIGTSLGIYRFLNASPPRVRIMAAIGSMGVTAPTLVLINAIENPNGFNRLVYSWMEHRRTGRWPATIPNRVDDIHLESISENMASETVANNSTLLNETYNNIQNNSNSFHWVNNDEIYNFISGILTDNSISPLTTQVLEILSKIFRPVEVEGYLDDLIGQHLFIQMLLVIVAISLLLLFISFLFIILLLQNKDYVLKRFNNKFIKFYLNYQFILAKLGFIILPFFIILGIIELIVGSYYIITHPLPYDKLPIDLHTYIKP